MKVTLYTTGCPKCTVLKAKLDAKGITYTVESNTEEMAGRVVGYLPMLEVDDIVYDYANALHW